MKNICAQCRELECWKPILFPKSIATEVCVCPCHSMKPNQKIKDWEKIFFDRLVEKLEEIFPKTNQKNVSIPSEGNRSGALALNAFANVIFRDIQKKVVFQTRKETKNELKEAMKSGKLCTNCFDRKESNLSDWCGKCLEEE